MRNNQKKASYLKKKKMKCLKKTELLLWGAIPVFSNTRRGDTE